MKKGLAWHPNDSLVLYKKTPWAMPYGRSYIGCSLTLRFLCVKFFGKYLHWKESQNYSVCKRQSSSFFVQSCNCFCKFSNMFTMKTMFSVHAGGVWTPLYFAKNICNIQWDTGITKRKTNLFFVRMLLGEVIKLFFFFLRFLRCYCGFCADK